MDVKVTPVLYFKFTQVLDFNVTPNLDFKVSQFVDFSYTQNLNSNYTPIEDFIMGFVFNFSAIMDFIFATILLQCKIELIKIVERKD